MQTTDLYKSYAAQTAVDVVKISGNARKLFKWLGSFWENVYEDPDFVKSLQNTRSMRISQLYLDLLENLHLKNRKKAPVFHRERWYPIIVRKSDRNRGNISIVKSEKDNTIVLGTQTSEIYPEGSIFNIGDSANYRNIVTFPSRSKISNVLTCIVDNIADPKVILTKGVDFIVADDSIALNSKYDPFAENSKFPTFELLGEKPEDNDEESVLWACDAEIDKNFIYDHLGYAIGLESISSEQYKKIVNCAWDIVNNGASTILINSLIASICDIPIVQNQKETVERLIFNETVTQVITDKEVYTLSSSCELRDCIDIGHVLHKGEFLDKSVKIYPYIRDIALDVGKTEYLDLIRQDVPVVDLPPAFFRTDVSTGFSVGWEQSDVICYGFDKNGNPKLGFKISENEEDSNAFWEDVWKTCEETKTSSATCFEGYLYDIVFEQGTICGRLSPLEYFLKQLIGANTLIITIDTSTIDDRSPLYDPSFFSVLRDNLPEYIRLFFLEHESVPTEGINLDGTSEDPDCLDSAEMFAEMTADDECGFGNAIPMKASYKDNIVSKKWVARCKDEYDDIK